MTVFNALGFEEWLAEVSEVATGWQLHATANDCDDQAQHASNIADAATTALATSRLSRAADPHPTLFLTVDEVEQLEHALDRDPEPNDKLASLMRRAPLWATDTDGAR